MATYIQKLRDPSWQKKRLLVLDKAGWACQTCCDTDSTLHVHHKQYIKGREPWEYDENQLVALCESCHESSHESPDALIDLISRLNLDGPFSRDFAANILAGWLGLERPQAPEDALMPLVYYEVGQLIELEARQRFSELLAAKATKG